MTTNPIQSHDDQAQVAEYAHDAAWELPEVAPVLIIISVGLLVLGSGVSAGMSLAGQTGVPFGLGTGIDWGLVTSALRWVDPATSTMLLLAAALLWWQYGYWSSGQRVDVADDVRHVHIARLRAIAKWNLVAFVVTIASVIFLILSSVLQNTYSSAPISVWAYSVETFCMALGAILLSLLGVVGLNRILVASRSIVGAEESESAS
jgi:hypothetical protein